MTERLTGEAREYTVMEGRSNAPIPEGWTVHKGDQCVYFRDGTSVRILGLEELLRELLAYRRAGMVKPLVWEDFGAVHKANAPLFGSIRVENYGRLVWNVVWSVPGYCDAFVEGDFQTAEAAKAAAQADYAARIRSCLVTPPPASRADAEFNRGYVIACCNMTNLHGSPEIAFDTLLELGITKSQVKAMDLSEYDANAMKDIERARGKQSVFMDGRFTAAKRQGRAALSAPRPDEGDGA